MLVHYCGSGMSFREWFYFEKQEHNEFKLGFIMMVL